MSDIDDELDGEDDEGAVAPIRGDKPMLAKGKIMLSPSWVKIFSHRRGGGAPSNNALLTESGDFLITEDGDFLVTEN